MLRKNYEYTMVQNFVYEHPKLSVNYLEKMFADLEDKYIPKIDGIIRKEYYEGRKHHY